MANAAKPQKQMKFPVPNVRAKFTVSVMFMLLLSYQKMLVYFSIVRTSSKK